MKKDACRCASTHTSVFFQQKPEPVRNPKAAQSRGLKQANEPCKQWKNMLQSTRVCRRLCLYRVAAFTAIPAGRDGHLSPVVHHSYSILVPYLALYHSFPYAARFFSAFVFKNLRKFLLTMSLPWQRIPFD